MALVCIFLEHAITPHEREVGLMHRTKLAENHGMTFNYEEPQKLSFWSMNCLIDLDVAFLDSDKVIQEIYTLRSDPLTTAHSETSAQYALEMNAGWFNKNDVQIGDQAVWEISSPKGLIEN